MARESARDDKYGIDSEIVVGTGVKMGDCRGGGSDSAQPVFVERQIGFGSACPGLHLDEGDHAAAAGDKVDLADRRSDSAGEDSPALEPKPPGGERLGAAAAPLGPLPLHFSACARS
jgi:hypothetical protein